MCFAAYIAVTITWGQNSIDCGQTIERKGVLCYNFYITIENKVFSQKAERAVREYFSGGKEEVQISLYGEGYSLLNSMEKGRNYDLYFLDVEMPEINGLELAQKVYALDDRARIVLVASHEKYAISGYKVRAYYFILKDEYMAEIPAVLDRMENESQKDGGCEEYYLIPNKVWGKKIRFRDIVYLTKEKKYVTFHCRGGREYRERIALGEAYKKLPQDKFIFADKGFVINMQYVSSWTGTAIKLDNGADMIEVPVSRRLSAEVKERLAWFWKKNDGGVLLWL